MANEPSLGSGIAEKGKTTIKQHRCIQDRMALDGMTEAEARKACGVNIKEPTEAMKRMAKKKGGVVKKSNIHASSKNHKFSY